MIILRAFFLILLSFVPCVASQEEFRKCMKGIDIGAQYYAGSLASYPFWISCAFIEEMQNENWNATIIKNFLREFYQQKAVLTDNSIYWEYKNLETCVNHQYDIAHSIWFSFHPKARKEELDKIKSLKQLIDQKYQKE